MRIYPIGVIGTDKNMHAHTSNFIRSQSSWSCRGWEKAVKSGTAVGKTSDATDRTEKSGGKKIRIESIARCFLRAVIGPGGVEFGSCHVENVWNLG